MSSPRCPTGCRGKSIVRIVRDLRTVREVRVVLDLRRLLPWSGIGALIAERGVSLRGRRAQIPLELRQRLKSADRKCVEPVEILGSEISARDSFAEQRPRLARRRS